LVVTVLLFIYFGDSVGDSVVVFSVVTGATVDKGAMVLVSVYAPGARVGTNGTVSPKPIAMLTMLAMRMQTTTAMMGRQCRQPQHAVDLASGRARFAPALAAPKRSGGGGSTE
jgi:hypothetical protein